MNNLDNNLEHGDQAFVKTIQVELRQSDKPISVDTDSMTRYLIDTSNAKKRGLKRISWCSGLAVVLFLCVSIFSNGIQSKSLPESNAQLSVLPNELEQVETPRSHLQEEPNMESMLQEQILLAKAVRRIAKLRQEIESQQKLQREQQRSFIREELSRTIVNHQAISAFKF